MCTSAVATAHFPDNLLEDECHSSYASQDYTRSTNSLPSLTLGTMLYCVPLLAQFVMVQEMEEQRWAELSWGLRFQVGAGDEV